jgi:DNA polymerase III psi subunit
MNEAQRQAYLDAMDIQVWVRKPPPVLQDRLFIAPGSGSTLLVCENGEERSTALAVDLCRYLGSSPVWGWPDPDGNPQLPTLANAIDQFMYTRVLLLGQPLASRICKGKVQEVLGSARVTVIPGLDELGQSPQARKTLWRQISKLGGSVQ